MEGVNIHEFLAFAFKHYGFEVTNQEGRHYHLASGHEVEVEGQSLFRLSYDGEVIAPFGEVEEMCEFIKQDMLLQE